MARLHIDISKIVKQIELATKDLIGGGLSGGYQSAFRGSGLEFVGYRPYTQNDDATLIDWKASRRSDQLLIKEFMEERNLNIFFLVDTSASMMYGSTEKLKSEYAAEFVASFAYVMLGNRDAVGYAFFNEHVHKKVPPASTKIRFFQLTQDLENPGNYGGGCNLSNALEFCVKRLPKGTMTFVVSDFIGIKEDYTKYLSVASQKLDLIGVMIRDPRDRTLPQDNVQVMVKDPFTGKQLLFVPEDMKDAYESYVKEQEHEIQNMFFQKGADFIALSTDKAFVTPLIDFFRRRQRKFR
ncbi:MAG TPA: DUF58 domain-containing protein [Candidatus Nanoarchaeia archaeon]|nr:DUF58 domain-containing protein [Candidatus Nanoarchaeia archaeon]